MSLKGSNILITGASMGIGEAIAHAVAVEGANLILFARSEDKLQAITQTLKTKYPASKVIYHPVDLQNYEAVETAVDASVKELDHINVLINNAGLALGAPSPFPSLQIRDIVTMNATNINGLMFTTYAVLNASMKPRKAGTILNVTSITGLEVPPFPGEAVYHCNKAAQEAFSNALRNELSETNIRVLVLRPGVVATNFHQQRVGYDEALYVGFMEGYRPLEAQDVARSAIFMLQQPLDVSIKALDVVPSAQRSINVFDRTWNDRNA
ncbi:NADP-dependent L-serine/L-allo-threonine dehydrogenase ydfG [Aspergillus heteromorphus CBS 117.55]|uniref:NADP-dependent L-serine/L-allo-threonine dehydrogenase ydfG n=1 Tax=Aspergillus heteromorphus CBS 117.55 TaxID=1448321 RepID=A0A317WZC5_9EURO|nr:NADP-dependent L-serine/L-allo-threonine dehydrogenase ydfG [Aspergillus heteromorphus CBS 117.55]PWY90682.1 NADP-dependent L-serine/L-allo-threonine dehydrogenase ydfG [Aspergillus heteromorphus CBS 117.55]